MYCNKIIKDKLNQVMCPFRCNDYLIVCTNCRRVDGYEPTKEACGFHDNKCKIRVWSIYLKKYYLNGVIFNLTKKCDIIITTKDYCRL